MIGRNSCADEMIACASPDYLARHRHPTSPADLAGQYVLSYSHLPDGQLWQFETDGKLSAIPVPLHSRLTLNTGEAMREFALDGVGLAMLPGFIVADAIATGKLLRVLPGHTTRRMPVLTPWPPISPIRAKLRSFVDHLAHESAGGRPWAA